MESMTTSKIHTCIDNSNTSNNNIVNSSHTQLLCSVSSTAGGCGVLGGCGGGDPKVNEHNTLTPRVENTFSNSPSQIINLYL